MSDKISAKVYLKHRQAGPAIGMHPWVFEGAIQKIDGQVHDGSWVSVHRAEDGAFIAHGLFNSKSQIRIRLYSWDEADALNDDFFARRVSSAIDLRRNVLGFSASDSCRLIYSEADQLSGITVDKFGDYLSVQVSSLALSQRLESILTVLQKAFKPKGIKIKGDRTTARAEGFEQAEEWKGESPLAPFKIEQGGLSYFVDLRAGQKTGFYLDQRLNRMRVAEFAKGARVLDLFSYAGGFGLSCLKGGAKEAICVDSSEPALALAAENAKVNGLNPQIVLADCFDFLRDYQGPLFDLVVLDPPRFVKSRKEIDMGMRKYFRINEEAIQKLSPGGILVTCSCSGSVDSATFRQMLGSVGRRMGRSIQILEERGAAPDHPVSAHCPETHYLKVIIARVN